jgi:archaellum biogenesis protein FlaJ (TadC family)
MMNIGLIVFAGEKIFEYASSDMDTILKRYHDAHEEPLETLSNSDVYHYPHHFILLINICN